MLADVDVIYPQTNKQTKKKKKRERDRKNYVEFFFCKKKLC